MVRNWLLMAVITLATLFAGLGALGNEFILADDVLRKLEDGRSDRQPSVGEIISGLEKEPFSLAAMSRTYGQAVAESVAAEWVARFGRHPSEKEARQYFGTSRDAVRRWMSAHGIPSPKRSQ